MCLPQNNFSCIKYDANIEIICFHFCVITLNCISNFRRLISSLITCKWIVNDLYGLVINNSELKSNFQFH